MAAPVTGPIDEITADETDQSRSSIVAPGTRSTCAHVVAAPFDNPYGDADLILRSSQGLDFYVHKPILRIASEFFATMLSLPQPSSSDDHSAIGASSGASSTGDGGTTPLPVVAMSEDSRCLKDILRLCYPPAIVKRELKSVKAISSPLAAAQKYQMSQVVSELITRLKSFCKSHPLDVYAEAFYRELDDIAVAAAENFVQRDSLDFGLSSLPWTWRSPLLAMDSYSTHLDDVPASWYYRLLDYYANKNAPTKKKKKHAKQTKALYKGQGILLPRRLARSVVSCGYGNMHNLVPSAAQPSHPFCDPLHADAVIRSSDGIDLWILRSFLRYSSTVFEQMLATGSSLATADSAASGDEPSSNRLLDLPEEGRTLALLFQLCYPMADPEFTGRSTYDDLHDLYHLFEAGQKYKVARAMEFARRTFISKASDTYPLRLYFIASEKQWEEGMEVAAMHCVYELADQPEYSPVMEIGSTAAYRRLLVYRRKCRDIILAHYDPSGIPESTPPASYWSTTPWLNEPGDARFWLAMHKRARENIAAGQEPCLDGDALFPEYLRNTDKAEAGCTDLETVRTGLKMSRNIIVGIAKALAEVCLKFVAHNRQSIKHSLYQVKL